MERGGSMTGKHTYGKLGCSFILPARFHAVLEYLKASENPFISDAAAEMMLAGACTGLGDCQAAAIGRCATSLVHDGVYIILPEEIVIARASRLKGPEAACWTVEVLKFHDMKLISFERVADSRHLGTLQIDFSQGEDKPKRHILRSIDADHYRLLQNLVDQSHRSVN